MSVARSGRLREDRPDSHPVTRPVPEQRGESDSSDAPAARSEPPVPWIGKFLYHCLPLRRGTVLANLRRAFGGERSEEQLRELAQRYYAHFARFFAEYLLLPFRSAAAKRDLVRVEGTEVLAEALEQGCGVLLLTGHFGNWEVSTACGIAQFEELKGRFHFIRKPLKPRWLNELVMRRFTKAGFRTLGKTGSLDEILQRLEENHLVVSIFDQHTSPRTAVKADFFGYEALTFKSLAILALNTGAPVIPASSWREPDGRHVLRFGEPVPLVECEKTGEAIRRNTANYNRAIEEIIRRHPEQWIWMHKRWK